MECGTQKRQPKEERTVMDYVCCVSVASKKGGLQHIWWECEACNSHTHYNWLQLQDIKKGMNSESMSLDNRGYYQKLHSIT
eukprot:14532639-Heterocapsa_arctica.AAC.1